MLFRLKPFGAPRGAFRQTTPLPNLRSAFAQNQAVFGSVVVHVFWIVTSYSFADYLPPATHRACREGEVA